MNNEFIEDYPIIQSDFIQLRQPYYQDADDLFEIWGDPNTMRSLSIKSIELCSVADVIKKKFNGYGRLVELFFVIHLKSINKVVGYLDLHYDNYRWYVDLCINAKFRKMGYAKHSLELIIEYCKQSGVKVIVAVIIDDNLKSIRLFEKAGFLKGDNAYLQDFIMPNNELKATEYIWRS